MLVTSSRKIRKGKTGEEIRTKDKTLCNSQHNGTSELPLQSQQSLKGSTIHIIYSNTHREENITCFLYTYFVVQKQEGFKNRMIIW